MFGKKYQSENTRQYKRLFADYLIKYRMAGVQNEEPLVANIKDISAGGMRFWTEEALPQGALVFVEVMVPPLQRIIRAAARVVRVRPAEKRDVYYAAVRFVEISEEDQNAINFFIERIALQPGARAIVPDQPVVSRRG